MIVYLVSVIFLSVVIYNIMCIYIYTHYILKMSVLLIKLYYKLHNLSQPSRIRISGHPGGYPTEAWKMSVLVWKNNRSYTAFLCPPESGFQAILGGTPRKLEKCPFWYEIILETTQPFSTLQNQDFRASWGVPHGSLKNVRSGIKLY